jgi:uncharacterized membrane protein YphA (DoxX/SURF4 family)
MGNRLMIVGFFLARVLIGLLLIVSGFEKAIQPWQNFAFMIEAYDVFPRFLETAAARVVPWVELFVGVFLIMGLWLKPVLRICQVIFLVFIVLVTQALWRGLALDDCGCFGQLIALPPIVTLVLDVLVFVVVTVMIYCPQQALRLSFDRFLSKGETSECAASGLD